MTTKAPSPEHLAPPFIDLDPEAVTINGLVVTDPAVRTVLGRHDPDDYAELIERMLAVGARGMASMGLGLDLSDFDSRIKSSVADALAEGRRQVTAAIGELTSSVKDELDPDQRASALARLLGELRSYQRSLGDLVDPKRADSHTSTLLNEMAAMLGPGGALDARLRQALDPESDASALAATLRRLDQRLDEVHQAIAERKGRMDEAHQGTAKGFEYEDHLDRRLREWARPLGATVERTSHRGGAIGSDMVGDFVVVLANGSRIVVEAKNCHSITLNGKTGILAELRRAMDNRDAQGAVCLSQNEAFPAEVGPFGVYGDAVLAVDDPDGTMLSVAMTWAAQRCQIGSSAAESLDRGIIEDRIERIRSLSSRLSSSRRALTDIVGSVEKVRGSLDTVRLDLLEAASDIGLAMNGKSDGTVVPIASATG